MAAQPTSAITFQNFFTATLTATLTSTGLDVFLDTVPNGSEGFLVIDPDSATNREIIYYTSKTATKVTCPSIIDGRGQDDTTATSHESGTLVIMAPIAAYYETLLSLFQTTPQGWTSLTGTFTAPVANGNRSYTLSTSVDQSAILTPGSRFRTTRTVAAPTQCTSLNGTTQFFSKTTPNGMSAWTSYTTGAWIKVNAVGVQQGIISREDGTNGWYMGMNAAGQIEMFYRSGAGFSASSTYQSMSTSKWVHVVVTVNVATRNFLAYIDGVLVPTGPGSGSITTLSQGGTFNVGAGAGTTIPFNGKIAQAFVSSTALTATQIKAIYSQGITPTDVATYSMVSAYNFNNSTNDINTANANNLTANGSAVATTADSPFGGQANGTISSTLDYGIVMAVTGSNVTVQVPEGCTIPTSGGITIAAYSSNKAPYGFPIDAKKWKVSATYLLNQTTSLVALNTWTAAPFGLPSLPAGSWRNIGYQGSFVQSSTVSGTRDFALILASGTPINNNFSDPLVSKVYAFSSSVALGTISKYTDDILSAPTSYLLYGSVSTATGSESWSVRGDIGSVIVSAEPAGL